MQALTVPELKLAVKSLTFLCRIEQKSPAISYLVKALEAAKADLAAVEGRK